MTNREMRRERYLRDALPVRLGGLAANLRRVSSFAQHAANREAIESLLAGKLFSPGIFKRNRNSPIQTHPPPRLPGRFKLRLAQFIP